MKPLEALAILDKVTDPRYSGQLTRTDYAATQQALQVIAEALSPHQDPGKPLANLVPALDKINAKRSKP